MSVALAVLPSLAASQYQVIVLPKPSSHSSAGGVSSGVAAGEALISYPFFNTRTGVWETRSSVRAVYWPSSSGDPVVLDPVDGSTSTAYAILGNTVGGMVVDSSTGPRAAVWLEGSSSSFVNLHPSGATVSEVFAVDNGYQAGYANFGSSSQKPVIWSGTAASMVDLTPPGVGTTNFALVRGAAMGVQVGDIIWNSTRDAYIWHGTAASAIKATPAGWRGSAMFATDGTQHAGFLLPLDGGREQAAVWNADGSSYTLLHPTGYVQSLALACRGGKQVGYTRASFGETSRAWLWSGSSESGVDLHTPLILALALKPSIDSVATGIDANGVISGYYGSGSSKVAVLWVPVATNEPPVADAGPDQEVLFTGTSTPVLLDGSGSSDPDEGDTLTYEWSKDGDVLGTGEQFTAGFGAGVHTITLTVTDEEGESSTDTVVVKVVHTWTGALSPIKADGSSVFKLGSTVPIKFQLTGASATVGNLGAKLYIAKLTNDVWGTEEEAGSTSSADSGNTFRYNDGEFMFNMSTKGLSVGTWRLRVDLGDGGMHTVLISLK